MLYPVSSLPILRSPGVALTSRSFVARRPDLTAAFSLPFVFINISGVTFIFDALYSCFLALKAGCANRVSCSSFGIFIDHGNSPNLLDYQ